MLKAIISQNIILYFHFPALRFFLWYMDTPPPLLKKVSYSRFSQFLHCLRCLSEWQQGPKVRYGQNKGERN